MSTSDLQPKERSQRGSEYNQPTTSCDDHHDAQAREEYPRKHSESEDTDDSTPRTEENQEPSSRLRALKSKKPHELTEEEKKEKLRLANRESARRLRQKRSNQIQSLKTDVSRLQEENLSLLARLKEMGQYYTDLAAENVNLKAENQTLRMAQPAAALYARSVAAALLPGMGSPLHSSILPPLHLPPQGLPQVSQYPTMPLTFDQATTIAGLTAHLATLQQIVGADPSTGTSMSTDPQLSTQQAGGILDQLRWGTDQPGQGLAGHIERELARLSGAVHPHQGPLASEKVDSGHDIDSPTGEDEEH